jgi:DNA polymerase III delta subunit
MIYLISGKDKFRRQKYIESLKKTIFNKEEINGFNYQELDNPEINDFCAAIQTPAFGAGKKLILIKDLKALENKSEDSEVEKIITSLNTKPDENHVIFNSDKISGTLKLVKKIKKDFKEHSLEEKFEPFKSWDLKDASNWLISVYKDLSEGKKTRL